MYLFNIVTAGFFLNNLFLKFISSAAINTTYIQLQNAASNFKTFGQSSLINFSNDKNSSSDVISSSTGNETQDSRHLYEALVYATGSLSGQDTGSASPKAAGVRKGNLMALSDDVITDALFTNIDTLQDHLEICEEELRQKLKLFSYRQLFKESDDESLNNDGNDEKDEVTNDEKDDNVNLRDHDQDDERFNDPIPSQATDDQPPQLSRKNQLRARKRRFALISENNRPLGKFDIIARKVIERLSARMTYLKSSLVECHLLVRQFG